MAYTPVELRHITLERGFRGYKRGAVDQLLADIADSFEDVWRERADLADRVEALETELAHHRERNTLLSNTLIVAERAASVAREDARAGRPGRRGGARRGTLDHPHRDRRARAGAERRAPHPRAAAVGARGRGGGRRGRAGRSTEAAARRDESREPWPAREDTREFDAPQRPNLVLSAEPRDVRSA